MRWATFVDISCKRGYCFPGMRSTARFLTDEGIVAMLEESDAGLSDSEYEEEWPSSPLASDAEFSGDSEDEPEPDIAQ
ncbi:hypothetical protein MRX96_013208 [Rhipicephalus microplus]